MDQPMTLPQAFELAMRHQEAGQLQQAEAIYRQILAAHPNHAATLHQLGLIAAQVGRHEIAVDLIGRAIAIQPQFLEAFNNLGILFQDAGQHDEAIRVLQRAIALNPAHPIAWYNLGNALRATGKCEPAIEAYRRAIALKQDFGLAHYNLALTLLLHGDYPQGWREFEHRFDAPELELQRHQFPQPQWDGSADLKDKQILLLAEQGFGDVIQFARFIPLIKQRGGKVVLFCQPEMKRLMQSINDIDHVMAFGQAAPPFDLYSPLLDLGRCFGTTTQTIPAPIPYLRADPQRAQHWKSRISQTRGRLKIGLFWHGRPKPNPRRSIPLARLAPLAEANDISFISLQKGAESEQSHAPPPGMDISDWTAEIADFADTADLIENLDLVITIDSAVAHLAGAMGKPVWVLLQIVPDWRWMLDRTDSPWYPTMKLFRQTKFDDWEAPIREIAQALRTFRLD